MNLADNIANWLVNNGAQEKNKDLYRYGAECLLYELISNTILLIFGLLSKRFIDMILWLIFFTILRVNVGGYHAKNHITCIILSTLLGGSAVLIYPIFSMMIPVIIFVSFLLLYIIIRIAPVINKNHPVSIKKQKTVKKLSVVLAILELFLIFLFAKLNIEFSALIFSAFFCATLLCVIGYIYNGLDKN